MASQAGRAALWRQLAAEALATAQELTDPEAKRIMLAIASGYKQLARRAEEREHDNSGSRSK